MKRSNINKTFLLSGIVLAAASAIQILSYWRRNTLSIMFYSGELRGDLAEFYFYVYIVIIAFSIVLIVKSFKS